MLPIKVRKLSLHKETVRKLTHAEMAVIAGGAIALGRGVLSRRQMHDDDGQADD